MANVKVTTKFLASASFTDEFYEFETAKQFVDREIEKLQAFYRTAIGRQTVNLTVQRSLNSNGDMIVKVLHPVVRLFNVQANFLVLFRIEHGLSYEPLEEQHEQVVNETTEVHC